MPELIELMRPARFLPCLLLAAALAAFVAPALAAQTNVVPVTLVTTLTAVPSARAMQTNQVASRIINRPLADVSVAMQSFCSVSNRPAGYVAGTREVAGVGLTVAFADCLPLPAPSIWPVRVRPLLRLFGWHNWPHSTFWSGTFAATSLGPDRTLLSVTPKLTNDTLSRVYLDNIIHQLKPKK